MNFDYIQFIEESYEDLITISDYSGMIQLQESCKPIQESLFETLKNAITTLGGKIIGFIRTAKKRFVEFIQGLISKTAKTQKEMKEKAIQQAKKDKNNTPPKQNPKPQGKVEDEEYYRLIEQQGKLDADMDDAAGYMNIINFYKRLDKRRIDVNIDEVLNSGISGFDINQASDIYNKLISTINNLSFNMDSFKKVVLGKANEILSTMNEIQKNLNNIHISGEEDPPKEMTDTDRKIKEMNGILDDLLNNSKSNTSQPNQSRTRINVDMSKDNVIIAMKNTEKYMNDLKEQLGPILSKTVKIPLTQENINKICSLHKEDLFTKYTNSLNKMVDEADATCEQIDKIVQQVVAQVCKNYSISDKNNEAFGVMKKVSGPVTRFIKGIAQQYSTALFETTRGMQSNTAMIVNYSHGITQISLNLNRAVHDLNKIHIKQL